MKILRLVYFFLLTFSCGELARMKRKIKTHRCKYTFVVNEMDAADCPNSLPSLQADREAQVSIPVNPLLPLRAPERISQSSGEVKEWLSNMEKQLYDELQKTRDINSTLSRHEHSLSKAEKLLTEYQSNFTTVFRMLRYLENTILTHGEISKNLDKKLSGVMLDVVEVNNVLSKKVVTPDGIIQTKNIEVQSVSKVPSCSISPESVVFRDCADVYERHKQSGIYYVTPSYASCPIPVWCDMDTTIGGWLLILKRVSGNINFNRLWNDYKEGFGDLVDEFYLGNDNIFLLTNQKQYEVRIDLWDFSGNRVYALYKTFYIDGERDNYRLHIHSFEGSARDALKSHDRVQFSTADRDNDEYQGYNCAQEWLAGWWFNNCWFSFLTGPYYNISKVRYRGISWNDWKHEQLPHIEMKIRPSRLIIPMPDLQLTETENKSP
ncbi:FGL2-like protein [Mya arenaria]|uniref:FGL2-like protein n=1 Tax=Mya arenaria TaxID=6604 RepID=A0ABY7ENK0_MYAAR|nr:techylectin-5B-like [Mya arenaria]XP_052816815.1 techylectin-5B-like [Mya arenaria]XP_052816816.1 techylectin-5B-like [Mya arenaria]WAR11570.1 FGL2-like protein [Mya arenaria]